MKKIIVAFMCIGMAVSAFAQGVNTVDQKHYNKVYFSYSPLSMTIRENGTSLSESGFNTFELGYMHGIAVAKFPLYIEFGGGLKYYTYSGSFFGNGKVNIFSLNIPVNVAYRMSFKGGKMHLTPFTGFYGRVNLAGKYKYDGESYDIFGDDGDFKRCQLGWQVGASFDISKFYVQLGYLTDLSTCSKSGTARLGGFNIGVGVIF